YALSSSPYTPLTQFLNVPESKVPDLVAQQKTLIEGNRQLIPLLNGSIYGGSYIDLKENKIIINTIDLSKDDDIKNNIKMKPYRNILSFVKVKNSLMDLNSTFEKLSILAKQYDVKDLVISNEYKINNIVIYLNTKNESNKAFIDDAKKLNPKIIDFNQSTKEAEFNSNSLHNSLTLESRQIVTCGHCAAGGTKNPDGFIDFYYTPWNDISRFSPESYIGPMTMSDVE
ncbi:13584_t:CDS:2, partial [Racocetra fulgida]